MFKRRREHVLICVYLFEGGYYVFMHMPICMHVILIGFRNDLQGDAGQPGVPGEAVRIMIGYLSPLQAQTFPHDRHIFFGLSFTGIIRKRWPARHERREGRKRARGSARPQGVCAS